jgi:hypothetical protein
MFTIILVPQLVLAEPSIDFILPTPSQGDTVGNNYVYLNTSASGTNNVSVFYDFSNSLVLWMRMDDVNQTGPGALVYDNSSYGNNGTAYDDANQTNSGYMGKGFEFDGDSDYVDAGNDSSLNLTASMTLSAWIYPKDWTVGGGHARIFSKGNDSGIEEDGFSFGIAESWLGRSNVLTYVIYGGWVDTSLPNAVDLNEWQHVALVWNHSSRPGNITFYVNGVEMGTRIYNGTHYQNSGGSLVETNETPGVCCISGNPRDSAEYPLAVGIRWHSLGQGASEEKAFNGTIDDAMVLNRALSDEEVAALYANQTSRYAGANITGLADGSHTFRAYSQDTAGSVNFTAERSVTVEYTTTNVTICRDLWIPNTAYTLQNGLSTNGGCLVIQAGNITVDMNGYNITGDGSTGSGVFVNGHDDITIKNGGIFDFDNGIRLSGSSNNNIIDVNISGSSTYDVYLTSSSAGNTFLNVSYDGSKESVGTGSELIREWHYRANVTFPSGRGADYVEVTAYNATGDLIENLTTNATGWTPTGSLIDYVNSSGITTYYYSNYTINASHPVYLPASKTYNVSENMNNLNDPILMGDLFYLSKNYGIQATYTVAIADLDNDGDQDYIAGNFNQPNQVYLNNGSGYFTLYESSVESNSTRKIAIADLDNDGDQDYIAGNFNQQNQIYLNNGSGHFTLYEISPSRSTYSIAIADLDLDGDVDYIEGNFNQQNRIYLNNGSGHFTLYESSQQSEDTASVAIADLDNDGDPDYISGNLGERNRVYKNNGSGHFTSFETNNEFDDTYSMAMGDIDLDGDIDYLSSDYDDVNRVYLNDGTGHFEICLSCISVDDSKSTLSIKTADLDNDGDLDYVSGNRDQENKIYINNGTGYFSLYENSPETNATYAVAMADLDNDGDLDYLVGNNNQPNQIYLNNKNDNNYVLVYIKSTSSYVNKDGIGTKVAAYSYGSLAGYREVTAADPSQDGTNQLHFGLSDGNTYIINASFINGKNVSCAVIPPINFTLYDNGWSTNGVNCYVVDYPPEILLMQPLDGNITMDIDVNFTCEASDDIRLTNLTIYLWNSTNDLYYSDTKDTTGIQNLSYWFIQAMTPDTYQWNCMVSDNVSQITGQPENYSLKVVIKNNLYVKLVINNTNNIVYIPGVGEANSSTLSKQIHGRPPHYYLASYLNNVVSGLVFSAQIPRNIEVGSNASANTHYLALEQDMEKSRVFLVFTLGNWREIETRMAMIEAGRFMTNIMPSFSYGLGNKYSLDLALGYADIDLQGRLRLLKGSHKIVLENNGTSGGKPVVVISSE